MAEMTTKPPPAAKTPETHRRGIPTAPLASVVDKTAELSGDVLKSIETGERAAIAAVGQFLITVEEAVPQQVVGTSAVAKMITESGLEMTDRLIHTEYDFLRKVVDSAAKPLSGRNGA
jgi:hypothetical protein